MRAASSGAVDPGLRGGTPVDPSANTGTETTVSGYYSRAIRVAGPGTRILLFNAVSSFAG
jgi:hypothetical protein